jgi:PAS domain S-box-containing protein
VTDITPLARSRIIETLDDAIIVIDDRGTITDINPAAERLLTDGDQQVVGAPVSEVLAAQPGLHEAFEGNTEGQIELRSAGDRRVVSPTVTPLEDSNGNEIGRIMLLYDVTALRRQRDELRRKYERLDEFATIVSHDLRSPLNVAQARLKMAAEECDSKYLEGIAETHDHMERLIEDLLSLASVGEGIGELESVELSRIAQSCWHHVQTPSAELESEADISVRADETRLRQLFENLLRNAVEHAGRDVTVSLGHHPDGFYVDDDGHGVPEPQREKVLEPGHSLGSGGTGFGLSIVRDVARAHDWDLTLTESSAGGARFEFTGVETH